MYTSGSGPFKNEASRRFYLFFNQKFEAGLLSKKDVAEDFGFGESYTFGFWKQLKEGKIAVNIDQIYIARDKYNLNPAFIFEMTDIMELSGKATAFSMLGEDDESYQVSYDAPGVGRVIDHVLEKHKIPRTEYAKKELNMSTRNLQRIMAGEVNPSFSLVAKIAEDTGESLDLFRSKPLPKGHMLQLLKEREERISEQANTIAVLQKTVARLTA